MSDIAFAFRFRDLVASTIDEHRKIINSKGACWWGWWKRPSEDARPEVWSELAKASGADPAPIVLFDSGTGKTYLARVIAIVPPVKDAEGIVTVPEEERDLIPDYYRASPFSRAWMKLLDIQEIEEFWGHYSFVRIEKLPGYNRTVLDRFRNKKINNPNELRSMDTTIWQIRPSQGTDHDEEILLSINSLSDAISQQTVQCEGDAILHITDMHFAVGNARPQHVWRLESEAYGRSSMIDAISQALKDVRVGLVIASGDFTYVGSEKEYDEAASAILRLLGNLDLSTDHLIIIPGNHDIQWATEEEYNPGAAVSEAPPKAKKNYEDFYRKVMRHEPNKHLAMGRRFVLPSGVVIEACALNSSSLGTGKKFLAGMGRIDEGSFADVASGLGWKERVPSLALRMLVIHHHLAVTENIEEADGFYNGFGIAVDAVRVQRMAARRNVQLAIHGHKHRAFIWRSTVYELPEHTQPNHRYGELSIVGGGSAGSKETEAGRNYFNLFEVTPKGVDLQIFSSANQGMFEKMQKYTANFTIAPDGGLKLLQWETGKQ